MTTPLPLTELHQAAFCSSPMGFNLYALSGGKQNTFVTLRVQSGAGNIVLQPIEADSGFLSLYSVSLLGLTLGYIFAPSIPGIEIYVDAVRVRFFRPGRRNGKFTGVRPVVQNADFVLQGSGDNAYLLVGQPKTTFFDPRFSHLVQDFES